MRTKTLSILSRVSVFAWVLGFSVLSAANQPAIVDVKSAREKGQFVTELKFDRPLLREEFSVDFINETVQINIPGAVVKGGKRFDNLKDKEVRSLFTYQPEKDLLRHRIILKKGNSALKYEDQVSLMTSGNTLKIKVGQPSQDFVVSSILDSLPPKNKDLKDSTLNIQAEKSEGLRLSANSSKKVIKKNASEELALPKALLEEAKKEEAPKKESEIPVLIGSKKVKKAESSPWTRMLISLAIVLVMGVGVAFGIKRYVNKGKEVNNGKAPAIKVIAQHYLGPKKKLAVVRVAGESILIGMTDHSINHIKTLSLLDEELPEVKETSFSSALQESDNQYASPSVSDSLKSTYGADAASAYKTDFSSQTAPLAQEKRVESEEDIAMAGLKDFVSDRLKGLRDL